MHRLERSCRSITVCRGDRWLCVADAPGSESCRLETPAAFSVTSLSGFQIGLEIAERNQYTGIVLMVLAALGLRSSAELTVERAVRGDFAVNRQVGPWVQPAGGSTRLTASIQAGALISTDGSHWTATGQFIWVRAAAIGVRACGSAQKRYR